MNIPILDSSTHPTISKNWINSKKLNASFEKLVHSLAESNISKALAVGLHNVEGYNHEDFINICTQYKELIPIAGLSPLSINVEEEIQTIKKLGYKGVKLHSRLSCFSFSEQKEEIVKVMNLCYEQNLVVFICTYFASPIASFPTKDPYWDLVEIIKKAPNTKLVLMHGGTINLLKYADLVRFNPNLLLDLSYTISKYKGSSVDLDMKYLFHTFDQKICIGSDYPESSATELRNRAEELSEGISRERKENIFFKNLIKLLEV